MKVGMNLTIPNYHSHAWVFTDMFKSSRNWQLKKGGIIYPRRTNPPPEDNEGYPDFSQMNSGETAVSYMMVGGDGHFPSGKYICKWENDGKINFLGPAVNVLNRENNRIEVEVDPAQGPVVLELVESNPQNPVRHIQFIMPGFENSGITFHPKYIDLVKRFDTARFMNWQATSNVGGVWMPSLEERNKPDSVRQANGKGIAIEYIVDLCNKTQINPYICMPHLFNQEYVEFMATYFRDYLDPDLKIKIEWSNEVWNPVFSAYHWARQQANDENVPLPFITAREAKRNWDVWLKVFGDEGKTRIQRVVAGVHANSWHVSTILQQLQGDADAIAVNGYLPIRKSDEALLPPEPTAQDIVSVALGNLPIVKQNLAKHKAIADLYNIKDVIIYEGGQHIVGNRKSWIKEAWEAQIIPEMYDLYQDLFHAATEVGVTDFLHFEDVRVRKSKFGSWGASEYQDETGLKMQALFDYIDSQSVPLIRTDLFGIKRNRGGLLATEDGTLQMFENYDNALTYLEENLSVEDYHVYEIDADPETA